MTDSGPNSVVPGQQINPRFSSQDEPVKGPPDSPSDGAPDGSNAGTGLVAEKSKVKPKRPPLYKVLLLNDDYTPMEFVVMLLMRYFRMNQEQAERIMIHVHTKGVGVCGVYSREIAETKVRLVLDYANENQHPLQCTLEQD
jgi:ATP-dependent Clp protease adaptor protein ClpS